MTDRTSGTTGALSGLRVVEMEAIGPLLHTGMMLADMGADVVRVVRDTPTQSPDGIDGASDGILRGRRHLHVDLKDPAHKREILELISLSDVVIEGFRPGAMERLGLGPDECFAANPGLIYGRMTGWGQDGPLAQSAGHDINYLAVSGALEPIGPADRPPTPPLNYVGNFGGGSMFLVAGVLAALWNRQSGAIRQVVDAAMVDGAVSLTTLLWSWRNAGRWLDERGTNMLDGSAPFYRAYTCADGLFLAVGAIEPEFYTSFVTGLGLLEVDLPDRWNRDTWPELGRLLENRIATRTRDGWVAEFAGSDACVSPVLSLAEAASHPHMTNRSNFVGAPGAVAPAPAPRLPASPSRPGPPPSSTTLEAVTTEWKGGNRAH